MLTVIAFLLLMVYMMIKHVKRLPKSYKMEIVDIFDKKMASICYICRSKNYSQFYADLYRNRYQFRVVGRNSIVHPVSEIVD